MSITYYYSPSIKGFLQSDINKYVPSDVVEITLDYKQQLMLGQSNGKEIVANSDGYPILQDVVISDEELIGMERAWRNNELQRADVELYKVQDSDPKSYGSVTQWREYRKALRILPEHPLFPSPAARPLAPDA